MHSATLDKFYSCTKPSLFLFFPIDIHKIEARVNCLPMIDEINARYLTEMAALRAKAQSTDGSGARLKSMSLVHYARSFQMTPGSLGNWKRYEAIQTSLGVDAAGSGSGSGSGTAGGPACDDTKAPRLDYDSFTLNIDVESEYNTRAAPTISADKHPGVFSCCQS